MEDEPKVSFGPKIFFGPNSFLDTNFFWTQHFLRPKIILDPNISFDPDPTIFSDTNFLWVVKKIIGPNIVLVIKCFGGPKFFGPKFFGAQHFFFTQIFFDPELFFLRIFQTQNLFSKSFQADPFDSSLPPLTFKVSAHHHFGLDPPPLKASSMSSFVPGPPTPPLT